MTGARTRIHAVLLAVSVALSAAGCSFIFAHGPPRRHEAMDGFTCTEGNTAPILDIIWGGLNLVTIIAVAEDPIYYRDVIGDTEDAIVGGSMSVGLSVAAAVVGFNKVKRCRAALDMLSDRNAHNRNLADSIGLARLRPAAGTIQAVAVSPHVDTLAVGRRVQLVATAHGSSGAAVPGAEFRWSSSNDAVASVNGAGLVTANARGSAVIAASADNVVGIATIVVVPVQ